jgi:hypothetical protein
MAKGNIDAFSQDRVLKIVETMDKRAHSQDVAGRLGSVGTQEWLFARG